MEIALKDVLGLMIDKKSKFDSSCRHPEEFNAAIYLQGSRMIEVRLDREKLAKELHWISGICSDNNRREIAWKICNHKKDFYDMADAILAKESEIIKVTYVP